MDNRDDENDKRRVMTPPAEWGGADDDDGLVGDIDWLSDTESTEVGDPEGENSTPESEATQPEAPSDTNIVDTGLLEPIEAESASEPDSMTDSVAESADPPASEEDSSFALDDTSELAMAPPVEDDNWLDTPDTSLIDLSPITSQTEDTGDVGTRASDAFAMADKSSESSKTDDGWISAVEPEPAAIADTVSASDEVQDSGDDWLTDDVEPTGPVLPATDAPTQEDIQEDTNQGHTAEALLTDHQVAQQTDNKKLPIWPIAAVVLALILLGVGSWGAYTERAALQAQVANLTNQLNKKARQGDLSPSEEQTLQADNQSLRLQLATLREQYAGMSSEIKALEQRLLTSLEESAQEASMPSNAGVKEKPAEITSSADTSIAASDGAVASEKQTSSEAKKQPQNGRDNTSGGSFASTPSSGAWFVNIASYSLESTAEKWAEKVRNDGNTVSLQAVEINDKTLYRVRAEGYASKSEAQRAAKEFQAKYKTGPLWVGEDPLASSTKTPARSDIESKPPLEQADSTPDANLADQPKANEPSGQASPVTLRQPAATGGWFIYVDTYSRGVDADEKAKKINNAGYEAKVAVEYRSGELFYRVQVVGIGSREEGERMVKELAAIGDLPNLQLRQY